MATITLTGSQALNELKLFFPDSWENELEQAMNTLKIASKSFKIDFAEAADRYFKSTKNNDRHAIVAALYVITKQNRLLKEADLKNDENEKYAEMLFRIEKSESPCSSEAKSLRSFYTSKQNELQSEISQIVADFPVIKAEIC